MRMLFGLLAVLLILTGAALLAIPPPEPPAATRGVPTVQQVVSVYGRIRGIAEVVNAPLSILFGLVSLYYTRLRYLQERDGHGSKSGQE